MMPLIAITLIVLLRAIHPASDHPFIPQSSSVWGPPSYELPEVHAEAAEARRPTATAAQESGHRVIVDYVASVDIVQAPAV
jgi:hypothetical protein